MVDIGLTHIALPVKSVARSRDFYARYAGMREVHSRCEPKTGHAVSWITDGTRPFVIVLIESDEPIAPLKSIAHLGVGCASRAEVDARAADARAANVAVLGPRDYGWPVGYWAFLTDPDGHTLELSFGQEVALTVEGAIKSIPAETNPHTNR